MAQLVRRGVSKLKRLFPSWNEKAGKDGSLTPVPLLSVIVPAYNVEEYLDQCIESLLAQTFEDYEAIIVVDGATDRTGDIAEKFAAEDERIRVIHQVNGGLSNARNTGLKAAVAPFVAFLDSDDWLPQQAYEALMTSILETGSDIATGNVTRVQAKREWPAWNQSFTHDIPRSITTTLSDTPNLLFDTTSWNKVYRRSLLDENGIRFPEGKLYEDMHPTAQAFLAARTVDIVPEIVYYYRVRDDNSSITQKRAEIKNLADKLEMVEHVKSDVALHELSEDARQVPVFKALEGDLPVYSPYLGLSPEFDSLYLDALAKNWSEATPETLAKLTLQRRVLFSHQLAGNIELAAESEAWVRNHFHEIPIVQHDGVAVADRSINPVAFRELRTDADLDLSRYLSLTQSVTESKFRDGRLLLSGFAFIEYLPAGVVSTISMELVGEDGTVLLVPSQKAPKDERANASRRSGNADRSETAFSVCIDVDDLFGSDPKLQDWVLWIRVEAGQYKFVAPATGFSRGGVSRLGTSAQLNDHVAAFLAWQPRDRPLTVRTIAADLRVVGLSEAGTNSLLFELVSVSPLRSVVVRQGDTQLPCVLERVTETRYVASFSLEELKRGRSLALEGGRIVQAVNTDGEEHTALLDACLNGGFDTDSGWQLRAGPNAEAVLIDQSSLLVADRLEEKDGSWLMSGRCYLTWREEFVLQVRSKQGVTYGCDFSVDPTGGFQIVVPYFDSDRGVAWRPGVYSFEVFNTKRGKISKRLRFTVSLSTQMPLQVVNEFAATTWSAVGDSLTPAFRVAAPLQLEEKGRYNRQRIVQQWRARGAKGIEAMHAALYSVDTGSGSGDSALAIYEELKSRDPKMEHYWAVEDRSVLVPDGTIPVVRNTELWHEVVNRSKLVVNNYGGLLGYNDWDFQYYIQTWHGTPLKLMGRSLHQRGDHRVIRSHDQRAQREASEWDLFTSQNPFMNEIARDEFFYAGEIIESGYARNDALVNADSGTVASARESLGIPAGSRVLLYAPTWRDDGSGSSSQALYKGLDVSELSEGLGDSWVILLRGHLFNRRANHAELTKGKVLDVTNYPNVNDLMISADVLVTDYSSIMFDFLATRKPVMYFAPDRAHYEATRGMYFEYESVLAGPLTSSLEELQAELLRLDEFDTRFGQQYQAQVDRFVPWDDGSAAKRIADRIMDRLSE